MPYINISDPNIIDLAAWHQVINTINQHSDTLDAVTNKFGVQGSGQVDWNTDPEFAITYSQGSQKIIHGRFKVDTESSSQLYTTGKNIFYGDISFADPVSGSTSFSAKPTVTATVQYGATDISALSDSSGNTICSLFDVNKDGFSYRAMNARSSSTAKIPLTGHFYINWTAIGPS